MNHVKYTIDQKNRMIEKLRKMKNGMVFLLNKKDPFPIKCKLVRYSNSASLLAPDLGDEVLLTVQGKPNSTSTLREIVDIIESWIDDWDLVTKQYSIDLAKAKGLDP